MHGTLPYMPLAMRKVMPYFVLAVEMLAITAYPMMAMGKVMSMITPRRRRRSDIKDTATAGGRLEGTVKHKDRFEVNKGIRTCDDGRHHIWDDGPQLHLVCILCKSHLVDNAGQLWSGFPISTSMLCWGFLGVRQTYEKAERVHSA